jgi:VanZ family protein
MKEKTSKWLHVVLFSLVVFLTLPAGPYIRDFIYRNLGKWSVIYIVAAILAAGLIITLYYTFRKWDRFSFTRLLWFLVIGYLYWLALRRTFKIPIESVHFVEYGILSLLVYRALRTSYRERYVFLAAFFFTYCIGVMDESIQWLLPNRVGALKDILLNAVSAGLVQLLLWKGIRPKNLKKGFPARSFRFAAFTAVACFLLTASYISLVSDFGYRIKDPEVGKFFSRITGEELLNRDSLRWEHYSAALDSSSTVPYMEFLDQTKDPFLYEMRVRVFRRDRHFEDESYHVSCSEEKILRKYFGRSLTNSSFSWPEDRAEICAALEKDYSKYRSPVSQELIVRYGEREMWMVTAVLAAVFLILGTRKALTREN